MYLYQQALILDSIQHEWIQFGFYRARPFFYIKSGVENNNYNANDNLLSLATFCDINLMDEAKELVTNYKFGPISIAIYIDRDYMTFFDESSAFGHASLYKSFIEIFSDINNEYDIIIGLLYLDKYSLHERYKTFHSSTPMMLKLPMNALRNLAEHQVQTQWILNIDIDFIYFSNLFFNATKLGNILLKLHDTVNSKEFGKNTIFIIPSFELVNTENMDKYQSLRKKELIDYIENEEEIEPFHVKLRAQICTNYTKWYNIDNNNYFYKLEYNTLLDINIECNKYYEPWYIMNTRLSKSRKYQFNNSYIGRGSNKVDRVMTLRHYCFNFLVLNDLFIIHKINALHGMKTDTTSKEKEEWYRYNRKLFLENVDIYEKDPNTCSFSAHFDKHCNTGKLSKLLNNYQCMVCCNRHDINQCGIDDIVSIYKTKRVCSESMPPCIMTGRKFCHGPSMWPIIKLFFQTDSQYDFLIH